MFTFERSRLLPRWVSVLTAATFWYYSLTKSHSYIARLLRIDVDWPSSTNATTNSTWYVVEFLGLDTSTVHVPRGLMTVLLYMVSNFRVGIILLAQSKESSGNQVARRSAIQLNLDRTVSNVNGCEQLLRVLLITCICYLGINFFTANLRFECEAVFIDFSFILWFLFHSLILTLVKRWDAKWFIFPRAKHFFPNAGQFLLTGQCFRPQNLYLCISLRVESLTSRAEFSHLLLSEFSHPLLTHALPHFVCFFKEFTTSLASRLLLRFLIIQPRYKRWGIIVNQDLGSWAIPGGVVCLGFHKWCDLSPAYP